MIVGPRWRRKHRGQDEGLSFGLRASDPASIGSSAIAEGAGISQQTVGHTAFEIVPDLFCRMKLGCLCRALFQMQPGIGMTDGLKRRAPVDTAPIPEQDDRAAPMPQQGAE